MRIRWRILACLCLGGLLVWFLADAGAVRDSVAEALALCARSVVPSLFPFLVASSALLALGFGELAAPWLAGLMEPLFRVPGAGSAALVLGLVGGYPIGAKTAADLYRENLVSREEAERLLAFWDMEWESETAFTCRLNRRDYYALRRAVKQLDCRLTVVRKEGVPFFLGRFRRRHALLAGLTLCSALLFFGSFFIWDFTVEGNQRVTDEEILRALQRQGVGIGTFGISLDTEDIRNHVLLEIPELLWITVNVSGCRAYVEVRERVEAPEPVDEREPTNVVARRDGLILDIQAMDGVRCVLPGTSVEAGELLISGVEDTETVGARVLTGMGKAEARTWYTLSTVMPLTVAEKQYTGEEKQGYSLVFGTNRVKFFLNSSIGTGNYDKITERTQWSLFGLPLPVTFVKETFRFYETVPAEVSAAQAESRGEAILTDYLHTLVDPYGTVSSTLCTSRREGDGLLVTLTAECVEEIGRAVPIYTDPTEESGG